MHVFLPAARAGAWAALGLLLVACTPALMRTPEALEAVQPLAVQGHSPRWRNETLSFGPYRTARVDEGTRFGWAVPVFGGSVSGASRTYRFVLTNSAGDRAEVECREAELALAKRSYEVDASGALRPRLACALHSAGAAHPLRLTLNARGQRHEGRVDALGGGREAYQLRSVHQFAGSDWPNGEVLGYELIAGGRPIAAVETINAGRVWLDPTLAGERKFDAAAMAAALLLFRPDDGELAAR